MHQGHGQSASAVPARRRVLADVGPARVDAETFDVARRPVRHAAPAPHQDRRPRRRDEDDDPSALADLLPRAGYPALRSRTHTAPRHLTGGARAPQIFTIVPSTANPPRPKLWLQAGADAARPNAGEIQRNHPKTPPTTAEPLKRCIKRARCGEMDAQRWWNTQGQLGPYGAKVGRMAGRRVNLGAVFRNRRRAQGLR